MHDLVPTPAIGVADQTIGSITISEDEGVALASVAARKGGADICMKFLTSLLGRVPEVGKTVWGAPEVGFWIGPDQWMISAPMLTHEDIADRLKAELGASASVTEQSGGWVVFDVAGADMPDLCALLCNIAIRKMVAGDIQRTMIHQLGCFVLRHTEEDHIRIFGPRASAQTLHHALISAATSVA